MKFTKVVGKIHPNIVTQCEKKLTKAFVNLGMSVTPEYTTPNVVGGCPLTYNLILPIQHVLTESIPTLATDGKRIFYNPKFLLKLSDFGTRTGLVHESRHSIFLHVRRREGRNPKVWNMAVDYIVHHDVFEEMKSRNIQNYQDLFMNEFGNYKTLNELLELIKDPFQVSKLADKVNSGKHRNGSLSYDPNSVSEEDKSKMEQSEKSLLFFYADPNLPPELVNANAIYDLLIKELPKCPECGSIGVYPNPNSKNKSKSCDCNDKCSTCGDGIDFFGLGGTLDYHMDIDEKYEDMVKRYKNAAQMASNMAGTIPAGLEREISDLSKPVVVWKDKIRSQMMKVTSGSERRDYRSFKSRPLSMKLLVPKRKGYKCNFHVLIDTSGSMSPIDYMLGISQLASLDKNTTGIAVPADCEIYWDKATKLRSVKPMELKKINIVGGGGTMFAAFFDNYRKKIGDADFLIVITDGYLMESDMNNMKNPNVPVYWLITSGLSSFKPPFGEVYSIKKEG